LPFFKDIDMGSEGATFRPRKKSVPLVSELVSDVATRAKYASKMQSFPSQTVDSFQVLRVRYFGIVFFSPSSSSPVHFPAYLSGFESGQTDRQTIGRASFPLSIRN